MARKEKVTKTDTMLVYGIAGILVVGAIGILMNIGKKDETGGVSVPEPAVQAMSAGAQKSGCGCGA